MLFNAANIQASYRFGGVWTPSAESAADHDCVYGDPVLPGVEGCDYLRGTIVADEFGVIAIDSGFGAIAGLQLDYPVLSNPEPSVLLLHGVAIGFFVMRRRGKA